MEINLILKINNFEFLLLVQYISASLKNDNEKVHLILNIIFNIYNHWLS